MLILAKVVYLVPLKSLAEEKFLDFNKKYQHLESRAGNSI